MKETTEYLIEQSPQKYSPPPLSHFELLVGRWIGRERDAQGLTKSALARRVAARMGNQMDSSYLSRMERGQVAIPARTMEALVAELGHDMGVMTRDIYPGTTVDESFVAMVQELPIAIRRRLNTAARLCPQILKQAIHSLSGLIEASSNLDLDKQS